MYHFERAGAIQRAFEYFAGRAALGFIIPEWLPTPDNQQYMKAVRQLDSVVYSIIDSRRAALVASRPQGLQQVGTHHASSGNIGDQEQSVPVQSCTVEGLPLQFCIMQALYVCRDSDLL